MSKGKGHAGKQVWGQRKGKVPVNKWAWIYTEDKGEDKGLESDDGGESVGEKLESSSACYDFEGRPQQW